MASFDGIVLVFGLGYLALTIYLVYLFINMAQNTDKTKQSLSRIEITLGLIASKLSGEEVEAEKNPTAEELISDATDNITSILRILEESEIRHRKNIFSKMGLYDTASYNRESEEALNRIGRIIRTLNYDFENYGYGLPPEHLRSTEALIKYYNDQG